MAKSLTRLIFNKGGFGPHLTREETIEHLNPLIEQHWALNHSYNYVINNVSDPEVAEQLEAFQKTARADIGKLNETVFSAGGVAYNGVDLEPEDFDLGSEDDGMLFELLDLEEAFHEALSDELELNHQLRTEAVLNVLRTNSQARLNYLRTATKRRQRPAPSAETNA